MIVKELIKELEKLDQNKQITIMGFSGYDVETSVDELITIDTIENSKQEIYDFAGIETSNYIIY